MCVCIYKYTYIVFFYILRGAYIDLISVIITCKHLACAICVALDCMWFEQEMRVVVIKIINNKSVIATETGSG